MRSNREYTNQGQIYEYERGVEKGALSRTELSDYWYSICGKIVVELKVRPRLGYTHIKQVMDYLKTIGCKLAILIYFTRDGVKYRRVINSYIE
jgi:GxxExxY protein